MKENDILRKSNRVEDTDEVVSRAPHRHWDLLVALMCILLAFVVWLCVMNARSTDLIAVRVKDPADGLVYELSVDSLEVEGVTVAVKRAKAILVEVPATVGEYMITAEQILLPEGVNLTSTPNVKVTVRAK